MGMDLYGLKPKQHLKATKLVKAVQDDFEEFWKLEKGEQDKYLEENRKFQEANVGAYFRNNVWYWRPLWEYVCTECNLTKDQYQEGNGNGGLEIDEITAKNIAIKLFLLLEEGKVDEYEKEYSKCSDKCGESPEYPFDVENVREFAVFCDESGGFQIC